MTKHTLIDAWRALPWHVIAMKVNKFAPKLVLVVLLLLLLRSLVELAGSFFEDEETEVVSRHSQQTAMRSNNKIASSSLNQVVQYHLFGDAATKPAVSQQKVINAPDTRLQLVLQGVFASTNKEKALAIIATKKGKGKAYRIGGKVTGGAELHAVYVDRVILKRDGKLETLRLLKASTKNLYSKDAAKVSRFNKSLQPPKQANKPLVELRKTLLSNPAQLWRQVKVTPVMKNGKVKGYSLLHNDKSLMDSLGIYPSDTILEVNGKPLSNTAVLSGLMNTLPKQKNLALTIERNGKRESIQLRF